MPRRCRRYAHPNDGERRARPPLPPPRAPGVIVNVAPPTQRHHHGDDTCKHSHGCIELRRNASSGIIAGLWRIPCACPNNRTLDTRCSGCGCSAICVIRIGSIMVRQHIIPSSPHGQSLLCQLRAQDPRHQMYIGLISERPLSRSTASQAQYANMRP